MNTNISFFQIGRFIKERRKIIITSALIFTGIYMYFVKFYNESFSLFYYEKPTWTIPLLKKTDYNIYRGGNVGIYFQIGEIITENNNRHLDIFGFKKEIRTQIVPSARHSSGGYENVLKVLGDSRGKAFGLIQEEAYAGNKLIRDELNFVSPLYLERMHILYKIHGDILKEKYTISNNTDYETLSFLSGSKINLGSPNSGTHIISRYVINELNEQIAETNKETEETELRLINDFSYIGGTDALDSLEYGEIDIVCVITGAPTIDITRLLKENNHYGLIGIEPDFTANLNKKHSINLNFTTFNKKYEEFDDVTTFGTFAYLITNKKTPPSHIYEILRVLNDNKSQMNESLGIVDTNKITPPLSEFDFLGHYRNKNIGYKKSVGRNIFLYIITLIPSTVFLFHLITVLISVSKKDKYHDQLVEVIDKHIPKNRLPSFISYAKLTEEFDFKELNENEYQMLKIRALQHLFEENKRVVDLYQYKEKLKNQNRKEKYVQSRNEFDVSKDQFVKEIKILDQLELVKLLVGLVSFIRLKDVEIPEIEYLLADIGKLDEMDSFQIDQILTKKIYDSEWLLKNSIGNSPVFKPSFLESVTNTFSDKNRMILSFLNILNTADVRAFLTDNLNTNNLNYTLGDHTLPFLKKNQNLIVNRVITGISKLLEMRTRVSEDFTNGMLTTRHYNFLFEKIDTIIGKLRKTLAHRLNQVIKTNDVDIATYKQLINVYFTSDYLNVSEYELLMKNFE